MRPTELPALTGVRFYAALFVYLSHVLILPGMENFGGQHLVFNAGVVGVSFFFVLSGFILTYNYADIFRDGVSGSNYRRFIWDRLTKIYPVHLLAMLMVLPIQIFSPNLPLDWRAVPVHLLLLQCFVPFATFGGYLNVPSWSISCEWFFYLLAPMAIFFAWGAINSWAKAFLVGAYAVVLGLIFWYTQSSDGGRLYVVSWFAPSRFLEFLAGVFLGRTFLTILGPTPAILAGLAQCAGCALIVAGALYRAQAPWPLWGGLLYVPGSALLILGLALGRGLFGGHLSSPFLRRLGVASFSLYMVHAPILRATKGIWLHFGWEVGSWRAFGVVAAGMFVVVQAVALIVYYRYEMPVQRRLRTLISRRVLSQSRQSGSALRRDEEPAIAKFKVRIVENS